MKLRHDQVMSAIQSKEDLRAWLNDTPREVGLVIASRAALRVLPHGMSEGKAEADQKRMLAVLRACLITWMVTANRDKGLTRAVAARAAAARAAKAAIYVTAARAAAAHAAAAAARSAAGAADDSTFYSAAHGAAAYAAAAHGATDAYAAYAAHAAYADAVAAAAFAADAATVDYAARTAIWQSITHDANWCESQTKGSEAELAGQPLWFEKPPLWFTQANNSAQYLWRTDPAKWLVWAEWYRARLKGREQNWPLPAEQDRIMNEWLFAQPDEWWQREDVSAINAEIAARIAELSAPEPLDSDLEQVPRGLLFESSDGAVIGLSPERAGDRVIDTADARDSHAECLREAQAARKKWAEFQIDNEMGEALDRYIEALGPRLVDIRPRLLIVRGEKLRRLRSEQGSDGTNAPPIKLDDLINAHNVLVGLDPFLAGIERAVPGPADRPPVAVNMDVLKALITTIVQAKIADQDAVDGLRDVADNVPPGATLDDRRAQTAMDSSGNFARTAVALVKRHRWAVAAGTVTVPIAVGHWIQSNMDKLLVHFANEPSIVALLHWVATLPLTP